MGRKLLSFKTLLFIIPIHAALFLLHAGDSVSPSRTHASQAMKEEKQQRLPVVLHQNITEALCRGKVLVNKLPAACLKDTAYCATVRPSTAVTHCEFPREKLCSRNLAVSPPVLWKKEGIFPWNLCIYFKAGQSIGWSRQSVAHSLRNSSVPSWQEVPEWGGLHLAAWVTSSSPTMINPSQSTLVFIDATSLLSCWTAKPAMTTRSQL